MFKKIKIHNWRQFSNVSIDFHPKLTVVTGANASGKTTVLSMLSRHFGWNIQYASTPRKAKKGLVSYLSDFWTKAESNRLSNNSSQIRIGSIEYAGLSQKAQICVPHEVQQQYNVHIEQQQAVKGIYISSHRPVYFYQQVQNIPAKLDAKSQLLDKYLNELKQRYAQNSRNSSASFRIKEAIISLATFGYGNQVVARDDEAVHMFEGFEQALRTILPKSLGFQKIAIHMPEVVFETETGSFSFDSVSGGIASLIDVTWQIFMASMVYDDFVVVMDEPENHLHPQLQRSLLPNLIEAFPQVQFVVATHNPFMVTSVPDSNVYVLTYNEFKEVESSQLDLVNRSGTSNEILREVLGVETTMPLWAENKLTQIVDQYSDQALTEESLREIKCALSEIGLNDFFPEAIDKLMGNK
ncbi:MULTISPECIES: AAA family ATPase [Idiomarina]|uniref:AAA family ATPase n=1 Tax=Idiomarina TaxID=135575 RepID=UPI000C6015B0|nr:MULTISPECIES: AAA family ATPase [Idiomarina]MBP59436.1 OLD family endonuclease [Idiomarina sp.]|tara:strand:+ start:9125 stop:10357 length:1233 start_codon:yes stop_codon:yes gene_type:complete